MAECRVVTVGRFGKRCKCDGRFAPNQRCGLPPAKRKK